MNRKKPTRSRPPSPVAEDNGTAGFLPELLRRGLTLGFTGFFLTEEVVRKALGESVPRDLMDFVLDQSERTRAEFLDRLSREFARAIGDVDPVDLVKRLLEGGSIEVSARIRLVPSEGETGGARTRPSRKERGEGE